MASPTKNMVPKLLLFARKNNFTCYFKALSKIMNPTLALVEKLTCIIS